MTRGEKRRLNEAYGEFGAKEAQEGRSAQAKEKALTAILQARESFLQALLSIQAAKESLEVDGLKEADLDSISIEIGEALQKGAVSLGEAFDLAAESFQVLKEEADTSPPTPDPEAEAAHSKALRERETDRPN